MNDPKPDQFVLCGYSCLKCASEGHTKIWRRPNESQGETVTRGQNELRDRCMPGCLVTFHAAMGAASSRGEQG